jgi:hypothetical protein
MAFGNTLATANEEVIKTLALLLFSDHHMGDGIVTSTIHFLIYCPRFASRFARDSEPSDRSPSRYKRDRQTAGSEVSLARLAQARPTQNDWLSSLTKSSDVNVLARRKHARIARCRNFQVAHFNKKHATVVDQHIHHRHRHLPMTQLEN